MEMEDNALSMTFLQSLKSPDLQFLARKPMKSCLLFPQMDMLSYFGFKTTLMNLSRVTTDNMSWFMFSFWVEKLGLMFICLKINFLMLNGLKTLKTLSSFLATSQPLPQCTTRTQSQFSNLERDTETRLELTSFLISP